MTIEMPTPPSLGEIGKEAFLHVASIPSFWASFAAFIPLAYHLASGVYDNSLTGEIALTGRIALVEEGSEFLERAAAKGNRNTEVWDVNWGSTFPCANGAASTLITALALKGKRLIPASAAGEGRKKTEKERKEFQKVQRKRRREVNENGASLQRKDADAERVIAIPPPAFRRFQELHILHFEFDKTETNDSYRKAFNEIVFGATIDIISIMLLFLVVIVTGLFGLYGTAAAVLAGIMSKTGCFFLNLPRPVGFMENNMKHAKTVTRLVGIHRNCSKWYLYVGDRGILGWLLNRPMVEPWEGSPWLACWFHSAHQLQLLAMTFVAVQKGWDGVALTAIMLVAWAFERLPSQDRMARHWIDKFGVVIDAKSFEFTGRFAMIAAIHMLAESEVPSWMDDILVPSPRRDAVLDIVRSGRQEINEITHPKLSTSERKEVDLQARLTKEALNEIKKEFPNLNFSGRET